MKIMNPYKRQSGSARGGLEKIYLIAASKLSSVEYDSTSRSYYGIELEDQATFVEYKFSEGEALFQESSARKNGNVIITQSLEFSLANQTQQAVEIIDDLMKTQDGLVAVVQDANGLCRIVGYSDAMGL